MMTKRLLIIFCLLLLPLQVFAASMSTLTENFNDNSIDTGKWATYTAGGASISETSQQLQLSGSASGAYAQLYSATTYDLTSSYGFIKIIDVGYSNEIYTALRLQKDSNNYLQWIIVNWGSGLVIYAEKFVAGVSTTTSPVAFDINTYRYLAILENGGTTYFKYSSDGKTWNDLVSLANPFAVTSLTAELIGYWNANGAYTIKLDDFNVLPNNTGNFFQLFD